MMFRSFFLSAFLLFSITLEARVVAREEAVVYLDVPALGRIRSSSSMVKTQAVTMENLKNAYVEFEETIEVSVWSNLSWRLSFHADTPSVLGPDGTEKSAQDIKWRLNSSEPYKSVPLHKTTLKTSPSNAEKEKVQLYGKILLNPEKDTPGVYSINLRFSLETLM